MNLYSSSAARCSLQAEEKNQQFWSLCSIIYLFIYIGGYQIQILFPQDKIKLRKSC